MKESDAETRIRAIGIIAIVFIAYKFIRMNAILSFWIAYILTRPLGASLGDLLSQPVKEGGLGLGTTITSTVFLLTILILVIYLTIQQKKQKLIPDSVEK